MNGQKDRVMRTLNYDDHCIILLAELSFQWITVLFLIITTVGVIILIIKRDLTDLRLVACSNVVLLWYLSSLLHRWVFSRCICPFAFTMDAPDRGEGARPVVLSAFAIAHLSFFSSFYFFSTHHQHSRANSSWETVSGRVEKQKQCRQEPTEAACHF